MPTVETKPVFWVLAWNPSSMMWTVRDSYDHLADAEQAAEAMQHRDTTTRVRVMPGKITIIQSDPPIVNPTRVFRQEQAGRMIEIADANKRYKSPG